MAPRVLVVGGGSGGTLLANLLARRRHDLTLLTASTAHLFQPGLLYVALRGDSGRGLVRDERSLLSRRVRLVRDAATRVDLEAQVVTTATGTRLEYERLVVATGMRTDPGQVPGLPEVLDRFGDFHSDLARARRLWASLDAFTGGTIVVGQSSPICKCPPSPVEAVLLADALLRRRGLRDRSRLVLFTPYPHPYPAAPVSEILQPVLASRGIEVRTVFDVDRIDPEERTIRSIEGDELVYDLPLVVPPFVGEDVAYSPAGVLDADRFVATDRHTLRVAGTDTAFAIGDATNVPTSKAGVAAHLQAKVVARELLGRPASFGGRTNCPFDFGDGRGTFVIGSYDAPVVKLPPTRTKHLMKFLFGKVYWLTLRGWLEPVFDAYFAVTDPARAARAGRGGQDRQPAGVR